MPDQTVLIAILAFAGILIGILAGARGQKILERRNNRHNNNPARPCAFDRGAWDELWQQEEKWRSKLWDKHDFLEDEIKDNRTLLRGEFKDLRGAIEENRRAVVEAIGDQRREIVGAINGLRRGGP